MRIIWSSFVFILTLVVGYIAFQWSALNFPNEMRSLIDWAQQLRPYLEAQGLPPGYLVLLAGNMLVLLGFIIITRLVFALIGTIVGPLFGVGQGRSDESAFQRWG